MLWCLIQYPDSTIGSISNCIEGTLGSFPITFQYDRVYSWIHSRMTGLIPDRIESHYRMTSEDRNWMMFILPVVTITLLALMCCFLYFHSSEGKTMGSKKRYWRFAEIKQIVNFYSSGFEKDPTIFLLFQTSKIKRRFLDWTEPHEFQAFSAIFTVVLISIPLALEVIFTHQAVYVSHRSCSWQCELDLQWERNDSDIHTQIVERLHC